MLTNTIARLSSTMSSSVSSLVFGGSCLGVGWGGFGRGRIWRDWEGDGEIGGVRFGLLVLHHVKLSLKPLSGGLFGGGVGWE